MRIGSLLGRRGLSALVLLLTAGTGCAVPDSRTELWPEGPPEILQVFVTVRDAASGLGVLVPTFGRHMDFDPATDPLDCDEPHPQRGCLDMAAMQTNAVADPSQRIRIVFDEVLDGATLEEFVCACAGGTGTDPCAGGPRSALDPSACGDNPNTPSNEEGRWLDTDHDGNPDDAVLLANRVSLDCDGWVWQNGPEDGFWNPSGNQLVPVATGLEGLGPALVVTVATGLRTGATCTLTVDPAVTDKDGNATVLEEESGNSIRFVTEPLTVVMSTPANGASGINAATLADVRIVFNVPIKADTAGNVTMEVMEGMDVTPVAGSAVLDADGVTIVFTPAAPFAAGKTYVVTVPTAVTDTFGGALPQAVTITFATMP